MTREEFEKAKNKIKKHLEKQGMPFFLVLCGKEDDSTDTMCTILSSMSHELINLSICGYLSDKKDLRDDIIDKLSTGKYKDDIGDF